MYFIYSYKYVIQIRYVKYVTIYIHTQKYTYLKKKEQNEHSSIRTKIVMLYYFNNCL